MFTDIHKCGTSKENIHLSATTNSTLINWYNDVNHLFCSFSIVSSSSLRRAVHIGTSGQIARIFVVKARKYIDMMS